MSTIEHSITATRSGKTDLAILTGLSGGLFLYHMLTSTLSGYGYFIDELYYIACSNRLAFGYIDHPPLSILLLAACRRLLGDGLPAIRFLPALAASVNVFMAGIIARRLGGGRNATIIAALGAAAMPVFLLMATFYSMNAFEPLIWTLILYFIIRLVQEENPKHFLAIGLLMGVGLEMKHTMILYAVALVIGMLLTSTRRLLWNRWFFLGMAGCFLLLVPNLLWQYINGFPSLEFYRNAMVNKNVPTGPIKVVLGQILFANPGALPLWIIGLVYLFFAKEGRMFRFLGWAYVVLLLVMVVSGSSRPDRIAAIYTVLFAAGAVAIERFRSIPVKRLLTVATIVLVTGGGVIFAPIATPLLPPPVLTQYLSAIGFSFDIEQGKSSEALPQWIADRLGWRELAVNVAQVFHSLPSEGQKNAVILTTSYGDAGALELYGPELGLPRVYATHNSYHVWGPPSDSIRTYIVVSVGADDLERYFDNVVVGGIHTCDYCTRPQRRIPIYVARGLRSSIAAEWPRFKNYN